MFLFCVKFKLEDTVSDSNGGGGSTPGFSVPKAPDPIVHVPNGVTNVPIPANRGPLIDPKTKEPDTNLQNLAF